ncbi:hypothetical protein CLUG_04577 [Clavispora lusitaniae ATCC 42720]|uniref:Uncharacterized protein n=1 Tax=Clavispora lusitaniae (strain ATCC 42720) TaxID=306902 RepID=C4Y8P9_CLAL4|nr:uncharacterized protein CLUG_04577 [Clavispora lusitaniae ATCC 42720]EEQ40448.1 hypothetical protein CLUG_04577 [Clavispora lusitaniae ATCC 42720]
MISHWCKMSDPGDWHFNFNDFLILWLGSQRHLFQQTSNLLPRVIQTQTGVDIGDFGFGLSWRDIRGNSILIIVFRDNFNWLNLKWSLAVNGEHGNDLFNNKISLCLIGTRYFNEYVFGTQRNLGVVRVDNWWQRAHGPLGVKNDWINWGIPNDV